MKACGVRTFIRRAWRRVLRPEEIARLHKAMRQVLRAAIGLGGSSISDFLDAEGKPGSYQMRHRVYGRDGEKCYRCGA